MAPRTPSKRGQVIGLHLSGISSADISRRLLWPTSTVSDTLRRWRESGSLYDQPRPGRTPTLDNRAQRRVIFDLIRNPDLSFVHIGEQYGVSESTIRQVAKQHGFARRVKRRSVYIRPETVLKRLRWAEENSLQDWSRVIFTDEMSVEMGIVRQAYTTRRVGEAHLQRHLQLRFRSGRQSIMVWGAVARGRKWHCF